MHDDPYCHHPELRGQIDDPEMSLMRKLSIDFLWEMSRENNLPGGWWYSDEEREALRAKALSGRWDRDLWVFGYGSLMWDPAFHFAEVRRARIEGYARKFILLEVNGGRGTPDNPGPMAALDHGAACEGLAFRIAADHLDAETYVLWHREQIAPGYIPAFMPAKTAQGDVEVLAFVADHDAKNIRPDLTREDQAKFIATGEGVIGTSTDYLRNVVKKLDQLGIEDAETMSLWNEVQRVLDASGAGT